MTIKEAVLEYQYDITINYIDINDDDNPKWYWDINGGYSSVGARYGKDTPNEALDELNEFLKTFKPFEK